MGSALAWDGSLFALLLQLKMTSNERKKISLQSMGCIKLDILNTEYQPLKVAYRKHLHEKKCVQRFLRVDPMAEKYSFQSPYAYAVNNPIRFIDFMGMGSGDPPGFWQSFGSTLSTYFEDAMTGVVDRIYEPSLLINDAANAADGIMTLASDVTGISNLVGNENQTANALGEAINTINELPSMSSAEQGAVAAGAVIMVGEIALTKKAPLTKFGSKKSALTQLKKDAGIPKSQQPLSVNKVELTHNGKAVLGNDGKPIMTRQYTHETTSGNKVVIQDHSAGHKKGNVGSHYNVRPASNTKTGKVEGTLKHYEWEK